jgi:hypothetical protein
VLPALAAALLLAGPALAVTSTRPPPGLEAAARRCATALVGRHGEPERDRAERGARQAAAAWRASDGDAAAFEVFCLAQFRPRGPDLDATLAHLESALEALDGHAVEVGRELAR